MKLLNDEDAKNAKIAVRLSGENTETAENTEGGAARLNGYLTGCAVWSAACFNFSGFPTRPAVRMPGIP